MLVNDKVMQLNVGIKYELAKPKDGFDLLYETVRADLYKFEAQVHDMQPDATVSLHGKSKPHYSVQGRDDKTATISVDVDNIDRVFTEPLHAMFSLFIEECLANNKYAELAEKRKAANENYTLQEGDTKTYVTTSVAYLAQHANVPCKHEPWLHLRRCQKLVIRGREIVSNEIGYVVYVWDTREVVQWIEAKQGDTLRLNTPKAVDNAKPLKDIKHLLPDWVTEDVKSSGNLWSMANMPKEVQDRYYNR